MEICQSGLQDPMDGGCRAHDSALSTEVRLSTRSKEIHVKRAAAVRDVHQFRFSAGDSSRTSPPSVPRRAKRFGEDSPKPTMVLKVVSNRIDDPFQTEIEVLVMGSERNGTFELHSVVQSPWLSH